MSVLGFLFILDPLVNFLPVYRHLFGCRDPNPDLIAFDAEDSDLDVVTNLKRLSWSPCEYQHVSLILAVVDRNLDLIGNSLIWNACS